MNTSKRVLADNVDNPPTQINQSVVSSALDKIGTISILKGSLCTVGMVKLLLIIGFYMIPNEIMTLIDFPLRNKTLTPDETTSRNGLFLGLVIAVGIAGAIAIVASTILTINLYRRKRTTETKLDLSMSKWGTNSSRYFIIVMSMMMDLILLLTIVFNAITIGSKHNSTETIVEVEFILGIINLILYMILLAVVSCIIWIISISNRKDITTVQDHPNGGGAGQQSGNMTYSRNMMSGNQYSQQMDYSGNQQYTMEAF